MVVRRRAGTGSGGDGASILSTIRNLDAYAKPLDDFRIKTTSGALVTVISAIVILLLVVSEFVDWRTIQMKPSLHIDKARKEKMWININVTFPKIPCYLLTVDVMDVAGEHQNDVLHDMFKVRLDTWGNKVDTAKSELGDSSEKVVKALNSSTTDVNGYCGSCYNGVPPESGCCNTCDEVRSAYLAKGWSFTSPDDIEQCISEGWSQKMKDQENEGCNINGHIEVNKVAGNFHFAPGRSFQQSNMHVHDMGGILAGKTYDFTHQIHTLAFGKQIGFQNPLDGTGKDKPADAGSVVYQYFLKVVGTRIQYRNGTLVVTNQFSVTEHERDPSKTPQHGGLPGVFFNFEISPMLVLYTEYRKPLAHFLTDVCAIVGGVFTVAGMVDAAIYTAAKLQQKVELGKAS
ncbi:hypothetical protein SmJEL517_g04673 [Synchytrium microbalum]|uniref:Endoplasmic reticulum vesicle transporter C-terminal domain-containing protein n=1 Tax=Synchytrium microbalum TaxID=1806994 RepID=A0A507C2I3_9FUNG|nr:uncharacterized protein SmJEL517_g04673 [Synchytrium microbalum]TPX32166.1 hypothetical protein SmJEL517_g04673 [Synchytrium microbalum]